MLSPDLQRIQHIYDYCSEIEKTISRYGHSFEIFEADVDYQRSVSFCILQIGELGNGLSADYRNSTEDRIQWRSIRGMRNLVAHSYGSMSKEIIWLTAINDIPDLKQFCEEELSKIQ